MEKIKTLVASDDQFTPRHWSFAVAATLAAIAWATTRRRLCRETLHRAPHSSSARSSLACSLTAPPRFVVSRHCRETLVVHQLLCIQIQFLVSATGYQFYVPVSIIFLFISCLQFLVISFVTRWVSVLVLLLLSFHEYECTSVHIFFI